jgi:hypothetical protein
MTGIGGAVSSAPADQISLLHQNPCVTDPAQPLERFLKLMPWCIAGFSTWPIDHEPLPNRDLEFQGCR